jgi:hypothetical protein
VPEPEQKRRCPRCGRLLATDAFYVNCAECKECKRHRSQLNRALQARKIAAFERFVEALVNLADLPAGRPAEPGTTPTSEVS